MSTDELTRMEAQVLAHDYNFAPFDPLKCERVIHEETDLRSLFLCNTSNVCKCLIQYHFDDLPKFF